MIPAKWSGNLLWSVMTIYDESILQQYADDLYRQAKWIIVSMAVRYGVAVFLVSLMVGILIGSQRQITEDAGNQGVLVVLVLTLVGIIAGVDAGRRKAFYLKLQAQQILCQRQTEINTRVTTPA
jgi:F0F1-type ATP synthase assembly protein I